MSDALTTKPVVQFARFELVVPEKSALAVETVEHLTATFQPLYARAIELIRKAELVKVSDISQKGAMQEAKMLRAEFRKLRGEVTAAHKAAKEDSLKKGRAIDVVKTAFMNGVGKVEDYLEEQENFEAKKIAADKEALRQKRAEAFGVYGDLIAPPTMDLTVLSESDFQIMLDGYEKRYGEAKLAKETAEKNAALKQQQDAEERKRLADEKAVAEAKQREAEQQAATARKAEADANQARWATLNELRQARAGQLRAEDGLDLVKGDIAELKAEDFAAIVKTAKERKAERAKQAEAALERLEQERQQRETAAKAELPDSAKIEGIAQALEMFQANIPTMTTPEGNTVRSKFLAHLTQAVQWLRKQQVN